jgi:hypothetical protein
MATLKRRGPLPRDAANGPLNCHSLAGVDSYENSKNHFDPQILRAAWIARRFGLAPTMARVIADMAFLGEGAR